ncbi:MAG TPA: hypothetical protein VH591_16920 [Ktedonobacterales bacterium]|jgi:hypothetical protein
MTQPSVIFFGHDGSTHRPDTTDDKKVYLRTLLYATSKSGRMVENMFVRVYRAETSQTFSFWAYGERSSLAPGSGLFVPEDGVTYNHHFVLPADGTTFHFLAGEYTVEVFASLVARPGINTLKLFSTQLIVSQQHAEQLTKPNMGILFTWLPDVRRYHPVLLPRFPSQERW